MHMDVRRVGVVVASMVIWLMLPPVRLEAG